MRFLWLYQYLPNYNFDHFLHMDVAECMNNIPDIEVKCYGPGLHLSNPKLTITQYSENTTINSLYNKWEFDVIIICTKSRMFRNYLPIHAIDNTRGEIGTDTEWLPKDFSQFTKAKKIVLEEDYHYEGPDKWYKDRGVDAILQRHFVNIEQGINKGGYNIPHIFFPFSFAPNTFRDFGKQRVNLIKYTGSTNNKYYLDRVACKKILEDNGILARTPQMRTDDEYINDLNSFTVHMSGQSKYYILPAKIFEIAACGSVLFTNANPKSGIQKVFSDTSYVKWEDDFSDVLLKANMILNDSFMRNKITTAAKEEVMNRHTHEVRTKELLEIVGKL